MAYRFKPGEAVASEFSRIARDELDSAIELVAQSDQPLDFRVHEARKHLKKLRALLALVGGALHRDDVAREKRAIQSAARSLAGVRDGAALLEAFDSLAEHSADRLGDAAKARVRALLEASRAANQAEAPALQSAERELESVRRRMPELKLGSDGWAALEPGFRATYTRARRAGERARKHPEAECLHRFRTPAKRHLYQVQLLEPLFPELLHAQRRELSRLGDLLGEHHDLHLLGEALDPAELGAERETVNAAIERRREELESAAFALEARLFAERPKALARRFGRYFAAST